MDPHALDNPADIFDQIFAQKRGVDRKTLEAVVALGVEIAREGREGRRIGTLFVVGDVERVLPRSRELILDPLWCHPPDKKRVFDHDARETIKELAQLDGAFLVSDDGVAVSACRYIDARSEGIRHPLGLGSRHMAAAAITKETDAIAVVVSESSIVRIYDNGELMSEIIPELWMFSRYSLHLDGPVKEQKRKDLRVVSKPE